MKVSGSVLVEDIMDALEIDALPEGCRFAKTDSIELDVVDVDDDTAAQELPESYFPEYQLREILNETDVFDLAAAIRRGDIAEAELLLDALAREDELVTEWVQRGRYSGRAKVRPSKQALRDAA